MPQIKLEVTARRKRLLDALCLRQDCSMESLFEGKMIDLEVNAAGLDLTDTPEDQEAAESHAQELESQARTLGEQAKILRNHAGLRTSRKLSLSPFERIDLATGAITRGKPDEVRS